MYNMTDLYDSGSWWAVLPHTGNVGSLGEARGIVVCINYINVHIDDTA